MPCWLDFQGHTGVMWHSASLRQQSVLGETQHENLKKRQNKNQHLPISPTLNISCVSVAAIFHTCKSSEGQVNRREAPRAPSFADTNVTVKYPESSRWVQAPRREARQILFGITALKFCQWSQWDFSCQQTPTPCAKSLPFSGTRGLWGRRRTAQSQSESATVSRNDALKDSGTTGIYYTEPWRVDKNATSCT